MWGVLVGFRYWGVTPARLVACRNSFIHVCANVTSFGVQFIKLFMGFSSVLVAASNWLKQAPYNSFCPAEQRHAVAGWLAAIV